jgi:hypothetical protein
MHGNMNVKKKTTVISFKLNVSVAFTATFTYN